MQLGDNPAEADADAKLALLEAAREAGISGQYINDIPRSRIRRHFPEQVLHGKVLALQALERYNRKRAKTLA